MRIIILSVGATSQNYISEGVNLYLKRLKRYGKIEFTELPDVKKKKKFTEEELKKAEGEHILSAVLSGSELYLLDEKGAHYTSPAFASFLQKRMNTGVKNIYFVIGGAYGFSEEVYAAANGKISLSAMTFPHDLVRLFFTEQLYRAFTILKGEPYHHR